MDGASGRQEPGGVPVSIFTEPLIVTRHRLRHPGHTQELNLLSLHRRTPQTSREAGCRPGDTALWEPRWFQGRTTSGGMLRGSEELSRQTASSGEVGGPQEKTSSTKDEGSDVRCCCRGV